MNDVMSPFILTLGDRYGVGPELVVRYLERAKPGSRLLVLGDRRVFDDACLRLGVPIEVEPVSTAGETGTVLPGFLDMPFDAPVGPLGEVSAAAGRESLNMLDWLADAIAQRAVSGAVYAPLNKQAMRDAGHSNGDEFDYLTDRLGARGNGGEINWLDGIWTSRVTSHLPLAHVAEAITKDRIEYATELLAGVMTKSGITDPRLVIAGLNPHAGERGVFGTEEITIIGPAVKALQDRGLRVSGPVPADTIFPQSMDDRPVGIVTMYHDQGQIALKLMGLGKSVTMLAGLGVPVTTPGHGTAYDIVGKGIARLDSMHAAVKFCQSMR